MGQQAEERRVSWGAGRVDVGPPLGTNGWARWAAICGVVALVPLGLVLGVVGLVQTRRSGQRGKGLALLGIGAAAAWGALLVNVSALPGMTVDRAADGSVTHEQLVSVFDVQSGDCFRWAAKASDNSVQMVTLVPCAQPHDAKVFARPTLALVDDSVVQSAAQRACTGDPAAKGLPSGARWGYMYPDHTGFARDSRRVICYTTP